MATVSPDCHTSNTGEVAEWLETFLEDQRELRPEFVERLDLAQQQLGRGESRVVNP